MTTLTQAVKKLTAIVDINEKSRQQSHADLRKGFSTVIQTLASTTNLGVKFPLSLDEFSAFKKWIEDADLLDEAFVSDFILFKTDK